LLDSIGLADGRWRLQLHYLILSLLATILNGLYQLEILAVHELLRRIFLQPAHQVLLVLLLQRVPPRHIQFPQAPHYHLKPETLHQVIEHQQQVLGQDQLAGAQF
jgi:hypothetical protein